jgi:hypothetical protein
MPTKVGIHAFRRGREGVDGGPARLCENSAAWFVEDPSPHMIGSSPRRGGNVATLAASRHGGQRPAIHAFGCSGKRVDAPTFVGMTRRLGRRVDFVAGRILADGIPAIWKTILRLCNKCKFSHSLLRPPRRRGRPCPKVQLNGRWY